MNDEPQTNNSTVSALTEAVDLSLKILRWILLLALAGYLIKSSVFVVPQHEVAFVFRLGRILGQGDEQVLKPGLHWAFPKPIDEIVRVPVQRVQSVSSSAFWYGVGAAAGAPEPPPGPTLQPDKDGYALTGDANILHSRWTLRYTINNPSQYILRAVNIDRVVRNELDRAVVEASARYRVDDILRSKTEFRDYVRTIVADRSRALNLGISVDAVELLEPKPPRQVQAAFDSVNQAEQKRSEQISTARMNATRALTEAQAEASRRIAVAQVGAAQLVSEVKSDGAYFLRLLPAYVQHPQTLMATLLQDKLRAVLPGVQQKYVVRTPSQGVQEIRLQLGPELAPPSRPASGDRSTAK